MGCDFFGHLFDPKSPGLLKLSLCMGLSGSSLGRAYFLLLCPRMSVLFISQPSILVSSPKLQRSKENLTADVTVTVTRKLFQEMNKPLVGSKEDFHSDFHSSCVGIDFPEFSRAAPQPLLNLVAEYSFLLNQAEPGAPKR